MKNTLSILCGNLFGGVNRFIQIPYCRRRGRVDRGRGVDLSAIRYRGIVKCNKLRRKTSAGSLSKINKLKRRKLLTS